MCETTGSLFTADVVISMKSHGMASYRVGEVTVVTLSVSPDPHVTQM